VRHVIADIASAGRQRHRLSIDLEDASAFVVRPEAPVHRRRGMPETAAIVALGTARGPGPHAFEMALMPWGGGRWRSSAATGGPFPMASRERWCSGPEGCGPAR